MLVDRAAVEDPQVRRAPVEALVGERAEVRGGALGVLGGRGLPRADRPDGLVGDEEVLGVEPVDVAEAGVQLSGEHVLGGARLALLLGLPHAEHRHEARAAHRGDGAPDGRVVHAEQSSPLGVPHDRDAHAQPREHRRADLAGVGAPVVLAHVLGAEQDLDAVGLEDARDGAQVRERREEHRVDVADVHRAEQDGELGDDVVRRDVVVVQLPVARDDRAARAHRRPGALRAWRRAARPGRSPCSSRASIAPPPVEMNETSWARPAAVRARSLSPPPTTL